MDIVRFECYFITCCVLSDRDKCCGCMELVFRCVHRCIPPRRYHLSAVAVMEVWVAVPERVAAGGRDWAGIDILHSGPKRDATVDGEALRSISGRRIRRRLPPTSKQYCTTLTL